MRPERACSLRLKRLCRATASAISGSAVQQYVEARNYSVVREFVGHGVGAKLHEDPSVPNYGTPGRGVRLLPGMTIAIEPMVTQGSCEVKILKDGWTTVTKDGASLPPTLNTV